MKISARNQFEGTVISIEEGQVNAKIVVDTGGQKLNQPKLIKPCTKGPEPAVHCRSGPLYLTCRCKVCK